MLHGEGGWHEELEETLMVTMDEGEDAEFIESDVEDYICAEFGEDFNVRSGVERVTIWQDHWDNVYKIRVNCVGWDDTDFEDICGMAKDYGLEEYFLPETFLGYIKSGWSSARITMQPIAKGICPDMKSSWMKLYEQLPEDSRKTARNSYCESFLTWVFTLLGEEVATQMDAFLQENEIHDIHTANFMIVGNSVRVFDAARNCVG